MSLRKIYTLVFIQNDSEILLGMKKRGFGCNKWNGFGGKVEPNETILNAAIRELNEECCILVKPKDLKNIAQLEFIFENDPIKMDVRVFTASKFEGTPQETEEMSPKWFKYDNVPYEDMWPDDKIWFPIMRSGKHFYGKFNFRGYDTIVNYEIKELDSIEKFLSSINSD